MTSHSVQAPSVLEICARVKKLGYGASARVRLYGEEFEVLSDLSGSGRNRRSG
jgi:hypothetical protein